MKNNNNSDTSEQERSSWITFLSIAGIAGPVVFWIILLIAERLYAGGDGWKYSLSTLVFGPYGWLQTANFYFLTLFTTAFGLAVYMGIARSLYGRAGSMIIIVMGFAQLLTAIFPVDMNLSSQNSLGYTIHKLSVMVSAGSYLFGSLLMALDMRKRETWHPYLYFTMGAALAVLCLDVVWFISIVWIHGLIDSWFGIFERILLGITFAWMLVISTRLLLLSRRS